MKLNPLYRASFFIFTLVAVLAALQSPQATMQARRSSSVRIKAEDGKEIRLYERSYALVIGVSDYTAGWPELPEVQEDVEAVCNPRAPKTWV